MTSQTEMKTIILFLLFCVAVSGAETGLRVITTAKTNMETATISTKEVFTRNGQTNLVCNTKTKAGVLQIRVHRFYHGSSLVGILTAMPDSSSTTSEAGAPCALDFEYGRSGELKYAAIVGKDGVLLDLFTCTNGMLFPVQDSILTNAVGIGASARELMSHAQKVTPEQFRREVGDMIEKHKDQ